MIQKIHFSLFPCLRVPIAVINTRRKAILGERVCLFILELPGHTPSLREAKEGMEAEAMEKCCLLACSSWLAQFVILYTLEPPAQRWHHLQ